ncbi:MAG: ribonuclease III [Bdellovibrionaceae bacterium]|nr:ribonuclease III [Pseudobdellovibrionaceae bacterium]
MMTLQESIGYQFANEGLLEQALTHKSYYNEVPDKSLGHNEKLEFLGDAVLDLCLSHTLIEKFKELDEGHLSKIRASLVNENSLMVFAKELGLDTRLRLGKGELNSGGREKPRLLASVFEAFIGAMYLDGGFEQSHQLINKLFANALTQVDLENHFTTDYKTRLQEKTQEMHKETPVYIVVKEVGPDHDKTFFVRVNVNGNTLAEAQGRSKKQAEQSAAQQALEKLS